MKIAAVINENSGSLADLNLDEFYRRLTSRFEAQGHRVDVNAVNSDQLIDALADASLSDCDVLLCCGGDGTASATAALCYENDKIYGLIPGGTMNLYARTLNIPLDPFEAVERLATADVSDCDIATANGRPFIHQFSLGIQPKVIEERDQIEHSGSTGKMFSGLRATLNVLSDEIDTYHVLFGDGDAAEYKEVGVLTVTNNPYGKYHLPYADRPDRGKLGIYWTDPLGRYDTSILVADILSGNWQDNPDLRRTTCAEITLGFDRISKTHSASLDGELIELEDRISFKMHPGAMKALVPTQ